MWKIGGIHVIKILGSKVWIVIQYVINLILKLIGTEIWIILNMGIYIGTVLYDMFYNISSSSGLSLPLSPYQYGHCNSRMKR